MTQNTIQRKGDYKIMSDKMIENNQVTVMGEIVTPFSFSHEVFGECEAAQQFQRQDPTHDLGASD